MGRTLVTLAAVAAALTFCGSALAIAFGQLDGNRHPNVGALIYEDEGGQHSILCSGTLIAPDVFLTASHCTAFLESIGVAPDDVWVTFDTTFDAASPLLPGTYHTNPEFSFSGPGGFSDPHGAGLLRLDHALASRAAHRCDVALAPVLSRSEEPRRAGRALR